MRAAWLRLRGEWWGLVGLIADVIVDWSTAMQNLANRRFRAVIDEELTRDTSPGEATNG
ncbi:MAG TPA: hypothetical protein VJQ57_15810 [Acidimicrobiia bacterium]|nr:hypothetical protein [Acidimicrobiia bacterium]